MLENPRIRRYSPRSGSDNAFGADNQQERPVKVTGILRDYTPNTKSDAFVKI